MWDSESIDATHDDDGGGDGLGFVRLEVSDVSIRYRGACTRLWSVDRGVSPMAI